MDVEEYLFHSMAAEAGIEAGVVIGAIVSTKIKPHKITIKEHRPPHHEGLAM